MISPFLTEHTKQKVHMISGKDYSKVHEFIDVEQLEVEYGGKNEFKYNFETHWNKEDLAHPVEKYPGEIVEKESKETKESQESIDVD